MDASRKFSFVSLNIFQLKRYTFNSKKFGCEMSRDRWGWG